MTSAQLNALVRAHADAWRLVGEADPTVVFDPMRDHYLRSARELSDQLIAAFFPAQWRSAVREPPTVDHATFLVITRSGDPHTRRMAVWGYQKCHDLSDEYHPWARQWGHANGATAPVEFYCPLPEMPSAGATRWTNTTPQRE